MLSDLNKTVSMSELMGTELVKPEVAGEDWRGVQHANLVDALQVAFDKKGLTMTNPFRLILMRGGADFTASFTVLNKLNQIGSIGIAVSNARRQGLTFFVGKSAPSLDYYVVVDRYGGFKDYPHWVYNQGFNLTDVADEAVLLWLEKVGQVSQVFKDLDSKKLSLPEAKSLLFEAAERKLIAWSRVGHIWKSWKIGKHRTGLTLLAVYEHYSWYNPPMQQMDLTMKFSRLILSNKKDLVLA